MENNTITVVVFTFAAILMSFSFGDALAQNTTSTYPNNTETVQEFEAIEGNNTAVFLNDTNISNPANNLENSLDTNENQSN
ncbi:hypothetical protein [Candidatus Nitrosocosmicus arcticus]|uniref:Uncharacterized protein n=1 Tax=Candidatus Nitrosocosmicus arcticus TaxID=2035267 RepID=A0A557SSK1_9ARCH|nr:hypothetical protein [Candidatus Nitrosocosmicus arcticus]TVP39568.1 exported protein of unknown function [Candidatus Nitrosocosmicus arcticus]